MNTVDFDAFEQSLLALGRRLAMSQEELRAAHPSLVARANAIGARAVGREIRVRLDRKTVARGTIASCGFGRFHQTPSAITAVFRVVMLCGPSQRPREVFLSSIPRGEVR